MNEMRSTVMHVLRPSGRMTHCGRRPAKLLVTTEEDYDQAIAAEQRMCLHCTGGFRYSLTERGFLFVARFEPRDLPQAIWIGDEAISGPFCKHCGNPSYVHGPGFRCLYGRIHPLLPLGDLPRAGSGFQGTRV